MPQSRPNPTPWVRKQIETIDATGDTRSVDIMGRPVVLMTMTGAKSGATIRVPVMRVERDGIYAAVASKGGGPHDPQWVHNLDAFPDIELMDGTETTPVRAHKADAAERATWWPRCVEAFPNYAVYQSKTRREIPVYLLERRSHQSPRTGKTSGT